MLGAVRIPSSQLFAVLTAICFAAGLNVYATVATIGLLAHTGVFALPPDLRLISSWYVIACSGVLFLAELLADKIPVFDLLWNALQTFVRVPVAALLAYGATSHLSPGWQLLATLLGGTIALIAHSGKTALRAAVTSSPEPFSNMALSMIEDALAVFLTWFATTHPYWAAIISLGLVLLVIVFLRWAMRALGNMLTTARKEVDLLLNGL